MLTGKRVRAKGMHCRCAGGSQNAAAERGVSRTHVDGIGKVSEGSLDSLGIASGGSCYGAGPPRARGALKWAPPGQRPACWLAKQEGSVCWHLSVARPSAARRGAGRRLGDAGEAEKVPHALHVVGQAPEGQACAVAMRGCRVGVGKAGSGGCKQQVQLEPPPAPQPRTGGHPEQQPGDKGEAVDPLQHCVERGRGGDRGVCVHGGHARAQGGAAPHEQRSVPHQQHLNTHGWARRPARGLRCA